MRLIPILPILLTLTLPFAATTIAPVTAVPGGAGAGACGCDLSVIVLGEEERGSVCLLLLGGCLGWDEDRRGKAFIAAWFFVAVVIRLRSFASFNDDCFAAPSRFTLQLVQFKTPIFLYVDYCNTS